MQGFPVVNAGRQEPFVDLGVIPGRERRSSLPRLNFADATRAGAGLPIWPATASTCLKTVSGDIPVFSAMKRGWTQRSESGV